MYKTFHFTRSFIHCHINKTSLFFFLPQAEELLHKYRKISLLRHKVAPSTDATKMLVYTNSEEIDNNSKAYTVLLTIDERKRAKGVDT